MAKSKQTETSTITLYRINQPIWFNNRRYKEGSELQLSEDFADSLLSKHPGIIEVIKKTAIVTPVVPTGEIVQTPEDNSEGELTTTTIEE